MRLILTYPEEANKSDAVTGKPFNGELPPLEGVWLVW